MTQWKDVSYEWHDERLESWGIKLGPIQLVVERNPCYEPDDWVISCKGTWQLFDQTTATSKTITNAKNEAMALLRMIMEDTIREINNKENKNE